MNSEIIATPQTVRSLKQVPASFRLAGLVLLRTKSGKLTFVLPNGTMLKFINEED